MSYYVLFRSVNQNEDRKILYYSGATDYILAEMEINLSVSDASEFNFTIYKGHPNYDVIGFERGFIYVYEDPQGSQAASYSKLVFQGVIAEVQTDLYGTKKVYCVGMLGLLEYVIQPQTMFQGSPRDYLIQILRQYNADALPISRHIQPGTIDTTDSYILRYTNYESTLECIRRDIMEPFNVYPKLEYDASPYPTLNFYRINDYGDLSDQTIHFGTNLLDYTEDDSIDELYTAVLPLGKKKTDSERSSTDIQALDAYVDISSVNSGEVVLKNATAIANYGYKCAVVHWDDVTQPANLLTKAQTWLNEAQYENIRLSLTAIDLSLLGNDISRFKLGDRVRCIAEHLGVNVVLPIYQMSIYPLEPEKNTITVGMDAPSLVGGTTTASNTRADAASAATLSEIMKISTYTCTYMVGGGLQAALTANDFQASTPSGYTPIAIQRIAAGNANMLIRAYNAKATGTSAIINLYNNSSVNVTATATVDIVYVKTEVLGT